MCVSVHVFLIACMAWFILSSSVQDEGDTVCTNSPIQPLLLSTNETVTAKLAEFL